MNLNITEDTVTIPVTSVRVGMRVDLKSCPYLKDEPSADSEWAVVSYALRETSDCFGIGYDGIDVVGYPIDTHLVVRNLCYQCVCGKWVSYEDIIALDNTNLEHARENELCGACQELDDVTHSLAGGTDENYIVTVTEVGELLVTNTEGKRWAATVKSKENG